MRGKAQTPRVPFPGERAQSSISNYGWIETETMNPPRKASVLSFLRTAARQFAKVLTGVLSRRKKTSSEECRTDIERSDLEDRESFYFSDDSLQDTSRASVVSSENGLYRFSASTNSRRSDFRRRSSRNSVGSRKQRRLPTIFSFEEIQKATSYFSPNNKMGEGGFGTLYKGKLSDGSLIAVKRARRNNHGRNPLREFKNELYTLSKIEHNNLVKLHGFLEYEDERILVIEYIGNGNLREHLDVKRGNPLEMADRLNIAIDVAHAITYLHTYTDIPVIHRDIKASNILITEKLHAKVADFGFAKLVVEEPGKTHISTQVKGSTGYVDPDYLRTFQLTEKSDVYSFGVVLVELVTGRRPIDSKRPREERITVKWVKRQLKNGEVVRVMDPIMRRGSASNMAAEKILKLAQECLADPRGSRPTMQTCAEMLWRIRAEFENQQDASFLPSSSRSNTDHKDAAGSRHKLPTIEAGSHR